jgi:hypothetical protein
MAVRNRRRSCLAASAAFCGAAALALAGLPPALQDPAAAPLEKAFTVAADAGWLDTGLDVAAGEELRFAAAGEVDLQKGNPGAVCGPAGIDLVTSDQPVPDANLGALIGKVAQFIAARRDEDTGTEVRDEVFALFLIGEGRSVIVPFKGRLYLGLNENVLRDNGGTFAVVVTRGPG